MSGSWTPGERKHSFKSTTEEWTYEYEGKTSAGLISGNANMTIGVACFTSNGSDGPGISISDPSDGFPSTIRSLSYKRQISGTFANAHTDVQRRLTSTSSFTVTGLNSGTLGFTVNGITQATFTNTYADGSVVNGTLSQTVNKLVVSAVPRATEATS